MSPIIALSASNLGLLISLIIIGGGLIWMLVRTITGKEVERRIVFLFIAVSVSVPILFHTTFTESASPIVKNVFERVEELPPRSTVLISFDFDPAMAPEVHPMANAFVRHCLVKKHKVVFMALWATGQSLLNQTLTNVVRTEFPDVQEGIDYVNLGYKAGNEGVLNVIVTDLRKMFPNDVNNRPLDSIPWLKDIKSCRDFALILTIGGGKPGAKEWVLFVGDPGNVPIAAGLAAVSTPQLYPYYPKQLVGLLGGIKGAAEYESELRKRYERFKDVDAPGLRMMGPQTLAHMVIIIFIIFGNISYFRRRKRGETR